MDNISKYCDGCVSYWSDDFFFCPHCGSELTTDESVKEEEMWWAAGDLAQKKQHYEGQTI
jgi:hypothetical protein